MKRRFPPAAVALAGLVVATLVSPQNAVADPLDCGQTDCAAVLPGAVRFEPVEGAPYLVGLDGQGETAGWVVQSIDLVDVKAYSGQPLNTLIGLNIDGIIAGARLLEHAEPILLVGIPEKALHDFIAFYPGKPAIARVVVGQSSHEGALQVDIISGATVTALAQNQTILKTARNLGVTVGVVDAAAAIPGRFVVEDMPWTWHKMIDEGVFGRLTVSQEEMGEKDAQGPFVDLYYTIADAPQIGRALLGDEVYKHLVQQLESGQHLVVILGNGTSSFKGSGFVRGGIFDRVRVVQGLREVIFRDTDYDNLTSIAAEGAPKFKEGAVFISRGAEINPGEAFELIFLGSRYDRRSAFSREFHEFKSSYRLPKSVYVVDSDGLDEPMYVQAWRNRKSDAIVVGLFLVAVLGVFVFRRWTTANLRVLKVVHVSAMAFSAVVIGFMLHAQPSVTQMLTLIESVVREWRWELFASAPLLFMLWIFTFVVSLIWGRGVFCGWVCPYGALTELMNKVAVKLRIPQFDPPARGPHRLLRYLIFFGLVPIFLWNPIWGEKLAEVEPFKTTFLVSPWTRHWGFWAYWIVLLVAAVFVWRPFCRYICPLGAGLALFNNFRFSGPRRRQFCSKCTICTKACDPRAIGDDGVIDPRECLSCMECESNYRNVEVCPPLVGLERLRRKPELATSDGRRRGRLMEESKTL